MFSPAFHADIKKITFLIIFYCYLLLFDYFYIFFKESYACCDFFAVFLCYFGMLWKIVKVQKGCPNHHPTSSWVGGAGQTHPPCFFGYNAPIPGDRQERPRLTEGAPSGGATSRRPSRRCQGSASTSVSTCPDARSHPNTDNGFSRTGRAPLYPSPAGVWGETVPFWRLDGGLPRDGVQGGRGLSAVRTSFLLTPLPRGNPPQIKRPP